MLGKFIISQSGCGTCTRFIFTICQNSTRPVIDSRHPGIGLQTTYHIGSSIRCVYRSLPWLAMIQLASHSWAHLRSLSCLRRPLCECAHSSFFAPPLAPDWGAG